MRSPLSFPVSRRRLLQGGMTLVECVVATVLSAILLLGLSSVMTVTLAGQQADTALHASYTQAKTVMQRLSWAIETANRSKKSALASKDPRTSGTWLYRYDPVLKRDAKLEYAWSPTHNTLREIADDGIPVVILTNVSNFTVTAPSTNSDVALIKVSLTVGDPPDQLVLTETRRLGGSW